MSLIKVQGLEKSYPYKGGRTFVLRQIGFEVKEGEFVTIMGPSGSGKSTLLAILGMLDGEFEGEYTLDGVRTRFGGVRIRLGDHPYAKELSSLGLPKRALISASAANVQMSFGDAQEVPR